MVEAIKSFHGEGTLVEFCNECKTLYSAIGISYRCPDCMKIKRQQQPGMKFCKYCDKTFPDKSNYNYCSIQCNRMSKTCRCRCGTPIEPTYDFCWNCKKK
jgi:hypothetical protein